MPGLTDSRSGPGDGERAGEARIKSVSQSDKRVHPLRAPGLSGTLVASPLRSAPGQIPSQLVRAPFPPKILILQASFIP